MIRRALLVCLMFAGLVLSSAQPPVQTSAAGEQVETKDCVVYVTRTGERYHKAGCRYLRYSSRAVSRSAAIAAGFTPCRVCGGSECER